MGRLTPAIAWRLADRPGEALDARVVDLLAGIARARSLAGAARALRLPYRTAWALLAKAERTLGAPLVALERGAGGGLAPLGKRLVDAHARAGAILDGSAGALEVTLSPRARTRPGDPLRVAASHDLALAELRDGWTRAHAIAIAFCGSAEAVDRYLAGRADLAGFHVPARVAARGPLARALLARLDPARDAILPFVLRTQGLILPAGNPRRVRAFADIARLGLRFVNRQPGSGTRIAIEDAVATERVDARSIAGWTTEEFTHAAVAASVAAGSADAGFGIRAAAAQLGLGFVPLVEERYAFAVRRDALGDPRVRAFLRLMASPRVARVVAPLPGYRLDARALPRPSAP